MSASVSHSLIGQKQKMSNMIHGKVSANHEGPIKCIRSFVFLVLWKPNIHLYAQPLFSLLLFKATDPPCSLLSHAFLKRGTLELGKIKKKNKEKGGNR